MRGGKNIRDFNPTHNQAHLQFAQANAQPKPVKEPAFSTALTEEIKHETLTNCKLHCGVRGVSFAGFSQHRSVLPDRNELRNPQRQLTSDRQTVQKLTTRCA